MTNVRKRAIKMYWKMAKKKCPFQTEEIVNGYLEGFIDCAEYLLLQIAELEEQIEKMKCCGNCKHQGVDCEWFTNHKQPCTNLNKWQLRR